MPTSPRATVLPVRRDTKQRLDEAKEDGTYDDLLRLLLRATPPERLRRAARAKRSPPRGPARAPQKQQLIASLAREGWLRWESEGRARFVAPRVIAWRFAAAPGPRLGVRLPDRRGFPDAPGA